MKITRIKSFSVADGDGRPYFSVKVETDCRHLRARGVRDSILGLRHREGDRAPVGDRGRRGPLQHRAPVAANVPGRLLPGGQGLLLRYQRHRHRALGHQGQGGRDAGVQAAGAARSATRSFAIRTPRGIPPPSWSTTARPTSDAGWRFVRWGQPETSGTLDHRGDGGWLEPVESMHIAEEQMGLVRDAVGPDIQLCFDVHTRLDTAHVVAMCKTLEPFRPFFIEDPLRSENPASYRTLARHCSLPIAAGEQWATKWAFREVIEEELINYARIDLCIVGGLTEALKITHWAETHYIDIVPHNPLGPVSAAACVNLCMASTNVGVQEMPRRPGSFGTDLFPKRIEWEDGYAWVPDAPGLGVDFDEDLAEQRLVSPTGWPTVLRRNDGAFTNW